MPSDAGPDRPPPTTPPPSQPPPGAAATDAPSGPAPTEPPPGGAAPTEPPPGADARGFAEPRALHPASIVVGVPVRQLLQGLFPAVVAIVAAGPPLLVVLGIVAAVALVTLVFRVLAWQRFRFSFDGEVLRVDEGVLSRNHRALDVERIQQVEIERQLIPRLLGLAAIRVETAGGGDGEVSLRVLPQGDAEALRDAVRASKAARSDGGRAATSTGTAAASTGTGEASGSTDDGAETDDRVVLRVGVGRIVVAAVTGSQLLVMPAAVAIGLQFLTGQEGELFGLDPESVGRQVLDLSAAVIAGVVVPLVILTALVVAVVFGVLRDHGWTMTRVGDDLHVRRGLLSTRESVVPLHRVQLVEVQRNWLRRGLGFASVRIQSAGGAVTAGGGGDRRVIVPLLRHADVDELVPELLAGVPGVPELTAHPRGALRRAVFRWTRDSLLVAVPLWVVPNLPAGLRALGGLVVVLAAALGVVEYRQLANGRTDRVVAARRGALSVTTGIAPLVKVQAVSTRASWFQRRLGVATIKAHVAGPGGDLTVLDVGADDGTELHRALAVAAADPIVPDELAGEAELALADDALGASDGDGAGD